ncbi:PAS domain S-box-containing protein [Methanomicrobium sp. W14]|uniref:PAS domain-containing sensor histidine kinase n=1 Tax=Methanomicrobium sp. W14 TaxID=2817839 RepID=UPI001AE4950F|nr:PAS domain-containing sensor histidine kinase [Methanomicrobium sp. W14]MBP2133819.1 PAS domain S-box-containing protein [Methanomicrobium sp. W14]
MNAEEYFRITDNFPVGVFAVDSDYRIIFWNKLLEEWTGKNLNEVRQKCLFELYPSLRDGLFRERTEYVLAGGPPAIFSSQLHRSVIPVYLPSGEPRIQTTAVLSFVAGSTNYAVVVIEDVTDLKREVFAYRKMKDNAIDSLNERIKAEKETLRANEEANLYLDIMSHDIANVNTLVYGYSTLLEEAKDKTVCDYSKRISVASMRSTEIINSVSTIRKIREYKPELFPVSLSCAVKEGVLHYGDISLDIFKGDFLVMADDLLPEIFVNLVGNSLKYGDKNVSIAISVRESGDSVNVCVCDDGPGIPDDIKPDICGRFRRGKDRKEQGSGLGLYIVSMLAERYGSRINITDSFSGRKNPGTRICFSLKKG